MVINVPMGSNKFYMANVKDIWVKVGADKRPQEKKPQFVIKTVLFPGNSPAV